MDGWEISFVCMGMAAVLNPVPKKKNKKEEDVEEEEKQMNHKFESAHPIVLLRNGI